MRIVHLSDIHAPASLGSWRSLLDKRLLGFANYYLRRHLRQDWERVARLAAQLPALQPDLVVCTGDITSLGEPAEFARAEAALQPIVANPAWDFVYVPGNHDAYVRCPHSQSALAATFHRLNRLRWHLAELPVAHICAGVRLLLINQAAPAPLYGSGGQLPPAAQTWLERELAPGPAPRPTLLISHFPLADRSGHPLSWRRCCTGIGGLREALGDGRLRAALCGHIHHGFRRDEPGGGSEVCAGSLTQTGSYVVLDYEPATHRLATTWHSVA
jgi:3',5'-cyclic AMP phosphodiesterase CpdA